MKTILSSIFLLIFLSIQLHAQKINKLDITPDGRNWYADFDCTTLSNSPLRRMVVKNNGEVMGLMLHIGQQQLGISKEGIPTTYVPSGYRVSYNADGSLDRIVNRKAGFKMIFSYEDGLLCGIKERSSRLNTRLKYNDEQQLEKAVDGRHDLKLKLDYSEGKLCKIKGEGASTTHRFFYDRRAQLQKVKLRGQGTLIQLDYRNGYITQVDDQHAGIPVYIGDF